MRKIILSFRTLWAKLKNGEYAAVSGSLGKKLEEVEPRVNNPGFTERAGKYEEEYQTMDTILKPQRRAPQSPAMRTAEKNRDKHLSFIAKTVDAALKYLPDSLLHQAALLVEPIIANFKNLKDKGIMDESGLGRSYVEDFEKPEIKAAIAVLNLTQIVDDFCDANELYISLWDERAQYYAAKKRQGTLSDARKRMDIALEELATYSNALYMAGSLPAPNQTALGEWIDFANAEIMSYANLLTHRGRKVKIDNPDIQIPDIENPPAPGTPGDGGDGGNGDGGDEGEGGEGETPGGDTHNPDTTNPPIPPFIPDFE